MSNQLTGRFWKWALSAGLAVGLAGVFAPFAPADDKDEARDKPVKKEAREDGDRKDDVKKDGDRKEEVRKDGDRKEEVKKDGDRKEGDRKDQVKKEGDRKEEVRKDGDRKEGVKKEGDGGKGEGKGQNDARIDELAKMVKQLAGQVGELRQEIQSLRVGGPNPEEMRKRMEEMAKRFGEGGLNPDKVAAEMKRRALEEQEKFRIKVKEGGGDPEAQIRREIERLQNELKKVLESKEREGSEKKKEAGRDEERKVKEGAEDKERGERKEDKK